MTVLQSKRSVLLWCSCLVTPTGNVCGLAHKFKDGKHGLMSGTHDKKIVSYFFLIHRLLVGFHNSDPLRNWFTSQRSVSKSHFRIFSRKKIGPSIRTEPVTDVVQLPIFLGLRESKLRCVRGLGNNLLFGIAFVNVPESPTFIVSTTHRHTFTVCALLVVSLSLLLPRKFLHLIDESYHSFPVASICTS